MDFSQHTHTLRLARLLAAAGLAAGLAACGGGSDDNDAQSERVSINGTASIGGAMINRPIAVVCKTGSGATTSDENGKFSVFIDDAVGPCVLSTTVAGTGGATLRSIAKGDGSVANITPLTELLVQYVSIQTGAQVGATAAGVPLATIATNPKVASVLNNSVTLNNSAARLVAAIKTGAGTSGASLTIPTDFLGANLVAKSATVATGNEQDLVLDRMRSLNLVSALGAPSTGIVDAVTTDATANPVN